MLLRDKVSTFIHHRKGVEMQCEPVVKDMVDSRLVHRESLITFPVNPVWLKRFLTQLFWDEVDKKSRDEQLEAFYPPKGLEAMVKDPKDKLERWAVREGAKGGKRSRNYKTGTERGKSETDKREVIELYEEAYTDLLNEMVKQTRKDLKKPADGKAEPTPSAPKQTKKEKKEAGTGITDLAGKLGIKTGADTTKSTAEPSKTDKRPKLADVTNTRETRAGTKRTSEEPEGSEEDIKPPPAKKTKSAPKKEPAMKTRSASKKSKKRTGR
jgi:hypothetical protein